MLVWARSSTRTTRPWRTGAPGFPPLAASADGQIYSYAGGPWVALGFGGSPAYPGS